MFKGFCTYYFLCRSQICLFLVLKASSGSVNDFAVPQSGKKSIVINIRKCAGVKRRFGRIVFLRNGQCLTFEGVSGLPVHAEPQAAQGNSHARERGDGCCLSRLLRNFENTVFGGEQKLWAQWVQYSSVHQFLRFLKSWYSALLSLTISITWLLHIDQEIRGV